MERGELYMANQYDDLLNLALVNSNFNHLQAEVPMPYINCP